MPQFFNFLRPVKQKKTQVKPPRNFLQFLTKFTTCWKVFFFVFKEKLNGMFSKRNFLDKSCLSFSQGFLHNVEIDKPFFKIKNSEGKILFFRFYTRKKIGFFSSACEKLFYFRKLPKTLFLQLLLCCKTPLMLKETVKTSSFFNWVFSLSDKNRWRL